MRLTTMLAFASLLVMLLGWTASAGFCHGTGAEFRSSANYVIEDTLGQFVVGQSAASDTSYACGMIEHGYWHSDVHIAGIPEIRMIPNYSEVSAYAKVVTAGNDQLYRTFYIADQDRGGALRVNAGVNPDILVSPGDMVDVSGVIKGTPADRYIDYPVVTVRFAGAMQLAPFFASTRWLGGQGTDALGGSGVPNTGYLMKTSGIVTYVDAASPVRYFYIDDGSGLSDGLVLGGKVTRGVRVATNSLAAGNTITPPQVGQYVVVTGICAAYTASGRTYAQMRPRCQADVRP